MVYKLIGLLAFILASSVHAEENPDQAQGKRFYTVQACDNAAVMAQVVMKKYNEQPLFVGNGLQFSARDGLPYKSSMMFFVNQDSGTWSLLGLYDDGTSCMVANGKDFEPYVGDYK